MISESNSLLTMPVAPMYGGNSGWGGGFGGGDWGSLIVLFLIAAMFGGFGGGFGGFGGGGMGFDFPWLMNGQQNIMSNSNNGFRDQMLNDSINSVRDGINSISTQLCNNQMADLERSFAAQTANTQGLMSLQSQLAQCCCENRLATANLSALVQSENCQDRYVAQENTRDIIEAYNRGNQAILDKLCALELDNYKRENDNLRTQLNMQAISASQAAEVDALYNRLNNCPVPTVPVYGRQPIFSCGQNQGCGCGGNGFYN